jgi:hypothetical protein
MNLPERRRAGLSASLVIAIVAASSFLACGGDGGTDPGPDPNPVVVSVSPDRDTLSINSTLQFVVSVTGSGKTGVNWSLREGPAAGTVSSSGNYTSGGTPGHYHIIATSQADPGSADTSLVLVVALPVATVSAPDSVLQGAAGLTASVPFQSGTFSWIITGGTLTGGNGTPNLTFTSGTAGPVTIQCMVTNLAGATATGSASTETVAAPVVTSWSASRDTVTDGESVMLAPVFSGGTGVVNQGIGLVTTGVPVQSGIIQFADMIYTLTVAGFRGAVVSADVRIVPVDPPLIFSFTSVARSVAIGDSAILRPLYLGDVGVTGMVDQGIGAVSSNIPVFSNPVSGTTLFTLTVSNAADSAIIDTVTAFAEPAAAGSFSTIGNLAAGRRFHTATLLGDGRVLVTGGIDDNGQAITDAEVLDPATGISSPTGPMLTGRATHGAVLLPNGKVLVSGGVAGGNGASAELFDPVAGAFASAGNMVKDRFGHTITMLLDGRALIIGGDIISSQAELYDPATGIFAPTDTMFAPRTGFSSIRLQDGRVLVIGAGLTTEIYNPASGQFSAGPAMAMSHDGGSFTLLGDGRVLAAGGLGPDGISPQPGAELVDVAANTAVPVGDMAIARRGHVAALRPDGTVLITGGTHSQIPLVGPSEVFDPILARFIPAAHLNVRRGGARAVLLQGGNVLIIGGQNGSSLVLGTELFQ